MNGTAKKPIVSVLKSKANAGGEFMYMAMVTSEFQQKFLTFISLIQQTCQMDCCS